MKMKIPTYRPVSVHDCDALIAFWRSDESFYMNDDAEDSKERLTRFIAANKDLGITATIDGKIIGTALGSHDSRYGYISHVAVDPKYRKQGIGRYMVNFCTNRLELEGIIRVIIFAFTVDPGRLEFWKKMGWTERGDTVDVFVVDLREERRDY